LQKTFEEAARLEGGQKWGLMFVRFVAPDEDLLGGFLPVFGMYPELTSMLLWH